VQLFHALWLFLAMLFDAERSSSAETQRRRKYQGKEVFVVFGVDAKLTRSFIALRRTAGERMDVWTVS